MKKNKKKTPCDTYVNAELPPCANFLNNANPLIKDGMLIFRNYNSFYYFITTTPTNNNNISSNVAQINTNIQVSLSTYLIGIFINEVQLGNIKYTADMKIHSDKKINDFIHEKLQNDTETNLNLNAALTLVISNSNAILNFYSSSIKITALNYYILFALNTLEADPALIYANNSHAVPDIINFFLASLNIKFPFNAKDH